MTSATKERPKRGLVRRTCDSRELQVIYTKRRNGYIVRSRKCNNCGQRMITRERPAGAKGVLE